MLRLPARLQTNVRRCCVLSVSESLAERKNLGREIKINHWPKSPIIGTFWPPDQENFCQGLRSAHQNESASPSVLMDSFRDRWAPSHGVMMHGMSKIHDRLTDIAKER